MYIVTGGAGFIGSAMVKKLNHEGIDKVIIVDNLDSSDKWRNLSHLMFDDYINKKDFLQLILNNKINAHDIQGFIHLGACSSTTESNAEYMMQNNYYYTKVMASWALQHNIRFLYASSAATYGDGQKGFSDDHGQLQNLSPLNVYGYAKHAFDLWALKNNLLDKITGVKFFNVFGPNEYHKGDMASVVYKAFNQIKEKGILKLFKSHHPAFKDGEQKRDFVYIKDCTKILWKLLNHPQAFGIYNLGTGNARTWKDLALATFKAMGVKPNITFVDIPESISARYQYFTQAEMAKLSALNLDHTFMSLEDAIADYVHNHLLHADPYM
ncbi:MAG: ADP-glyceromanno-heptose 6-epimerase [Deltaproteobacteria bacterium]|nr:ADP-glyceromanno-heptose 6-epimerase [Deltaproteobacteria bacterium]